MSDLKIIERLLEKYYLGETSSDEENTLREYFAGQDFPEHLKTDAELLGFFTQARSLSLSPEMEDRLDRMIESGAPAKKAGPLKWRYYWVSGVAAAGLILLGLFLDLEIRKNSPLEVRKDTYDDPYLAYAEAKRVLYMVSEKMNTGTKSLQNLEKLDAGVNYLHPVFSFGAGIQHLENFTKIEETKKLISK